MKRTQITIEVVIIVLLFSLALFVRMLNLDKAPLSDYEAGWALQSWDAVNGDEAQTGSNPSYFALTTSLFYFLGSSNFLARFWPALMGSLIIWVPFGFRRFLGREAALIMALGLALDPGMVSVSRIAGGPMMAFGFIALSLMFIYLQKPVLAGFLGGLGLLSGQHAYFGLTAFFVAYWLVNRLGIHPEWDNPVEASPSQQLSLQYKKKLELGLISTFATIILASTLFARFPSGISGWGSSLATFLRGWIGTPTVPVFQPVLAVVFYQPFATLFALITITRAWKGGKKRDCWLGIWLLTSLTWTVVYSQRHVFDSIWTLLPLWALASIELARYLRIPDKPIAALGQAGLLFVLGVIFWLVSISPGDRELTWLILLVIPVLALLTTFLFGLGWSWYTARTGTVWGICLFFGMYVLSATFGASQQNQNSPREFWYPTPGTGQADLLRETMSELALIERGRDDWIQTASLIDSASLRWVLRDIHEVTYISALGQDTLPAVIISPEGGSDLSQTMSYRGQDFLWYNKPDWTGAFPQPLWPWITSRSTPIHSESIVLWARSDLFPAEPEQAGEDSESGSSLDEIQFKDEPSE